MKKSLNHQNFSLLPTYKGSGLVPEDGLTQPLSSFCKRKFNEKCKAHYRNLKDGKSMCPYGFSSYQFTLDGKKSNWTGIKVKGAYSSGDVKIRSSAQGFKVYTDKDLQFLQLETRKLINKLNTIFDSKIENEKGNLDYSKKFTENAFHEIRPLNGKIKAAINQSKSMIGSQKANLGQDYNQIVNHLTPIAMCSDIATARMDARDLLTNPSSVRLGSERRINLKKEIKALGNLFKTILKKDEID